MVESGKKILAIGILINIAYITPWMIIASIYWLGNGFDVNDVKTVQYIVSLMVCAFSIITSSELLIFL